jgi:hypothetical protein
MAASAGWYLFRKAGESPCVPSTVAEAQGLVVNEILADPPSGAAGDANGDGVRDSNDDEFVELVNTGATAICLTGWTLGNASDAERHRFPIGSRLAPGEALVVFGSGIPTGRFGGAQVQWAAFGGRLDLNNAGDVLRLADPTGQVHTRLSWGDCGGSSCAPQHISGSLGIDQSLVRSPELSGEWVPHVTLAPSALFSPGTRADGTPFVAVPPDDPPPSE